MAVKRTGQLGFGEALIAGRGRNAALERVLGLVLESPAAIRPEGLDRGFHEGTPGPCHLAGGWWQYLVMEAEAVHVHGKAAELEEQVVDMRADGGHRHRQLAGDLRGRQVGRQIAQHAELALAERVDEPRGVRPPGG